jgi:hypothetical protein
MSERLISGDWFFGCERETVINQQKVHTDDRAIKARFYEHEIVDTKNTTELVTKYSVIVKCDVKYGRSKDMFSALIKKDGEKYFEMVSRFPKSWKSFIDKGGSFSKEPSKPTVKSIGEELEIPQPKEQPKVEPKPEVKPEEKDISVGEEIKALKEEYEKLEDKRCKRAFDIRAELKKLEV